MDLGICPRCGKDWREGTESCSGCGFVAIGAGLSRLPKKQKKVAPYREPGSLSLTTVAFILLLFLAPTYGFKPVKSTWNRVVASLSQQQDDAAVASNNDLGRSNRSS